ncbi:sugar ABC transporter permease [Rhizocola hellebori]|uniref:Sugar ABC transporter permease n=1 Tax=Rhizocola hellebori TaxID=1392758 RepID=A0A8J3QJK6_9ACTN|nr:ABC transporter permease subunit [Rhizocola hellebori]GIH10837.1 sugar ABC transporter permease [Rhizocola hellebori]
MRTFKAVWWRHAILLLVVVFALVPIAFVVSAALNPLGTLNTAEIYPTGASLNNFKNLFSDPSHSFGLWFVNSIFIALAASFASVFLSVCAAYSFSRMRFKGRRVGLLSLLLIQMFPQFLAVVAIFVVFTEVNELYPTFGFDSIWGLLLLYLGGALGVNTYLMKGFLDTVPRELDESATVDGASHAQIFWRIILPLVAPVLAVTAMLSFITTINEFLIANIFLREDDAKTLALGMFGLLGPDSRNANFGIFAAGTLLTAIPTVSVFLWLQRYIVSGLTMGAVKG